MDARSLELFIFDGLPDGMLPVEVFNWTGHVLRFPRTKILEALRRPESHLASETSDRVFELSTPKNMLSATVVSQEDYGFSSPSAAGAVTNGRSTNGRTAWHPVGTRKTYAVWETQRVADEANT